MSGLLKKATIVFVIAILGLSLSSCKLIIGGNEGGTVFLNEDRNCSEIACEFTLISDWTFSLTAIPADGYEFVKWEGWFQCGFDSTCVIDLPDAPLLPLDLNILISPIFKLKTGPAQPLMAIGSYISADMNLAKDVDYWELRANRIVFIDGELTVGASTIDDVLPSFDEVVLKFGVSDGD